MSQSIFIEDPSLTFAHLLIILSLIVVVWKWFSQQPDEALTGSSHVQPKKTLSQRLIHLVLTLGFVFISFGLIGEVRAFSVEPLDSFLRLNFFVTVFWVLWRCFVPLVPTSKTAGLEGVNPKTPWLTRLFSYSLYLAFPLAIGTVLMTADFPLYTALALDIYPFDPRGLYFSTYGHYLPNSSHFLILQLIAITTGAMLVVYGLPRRLLIGVDLGFALLVAAVVWQGIKQYQHYPMFHWTQLVELWLSGLVLSLIPLLGSVVCHAMYKLKVTVSC